MAEASQGGAGTRTVTDRIRAVMQDLGVTASHFGTSEPTELRAFISDGPDALSSLTLLNCLRFPLDALSTIAPRVIAFSGDSGLAGDAMRKARPFLAGAEIVQFLDYPAMAWTDMAADHTARIAESMLSFLERLDDLHPATRLCGVAHQAEIDGITVRVDGNGPALFLLPAILAPSQWDPLIESLAEKFAVVRLGGPHLGIVATLEDRGNHPNYRRVVGNMLRDAQVTSTDRLLEVGCGSGVISRWLARDGLCATPVTAIDLNPFLLGEARMLTEREGLVGAIDFQQGNAEALAFGDDSFDVVLSITVIEECDADKAISEMVRVVKPGGRVAVKVRACDMPMFWNLPLDPDIKNKAETPIRQVASRGCADGSLMQRFCSAGLKEVMAYPTYHGSVALQAAFEPMALSHLNDEEKTAWQAAKAKAIAEGTFYVMHPVHCAIGKKPQ
jgi:SAM-dependent methyltransferase